MKRKAKIELSEIGNILHFMIEEMLNNDLKGQDILQKDLIKMLSTQMKIDSFYLEQSLKITKSPYNNQEFYALIQGEIYSFPKFLVYSDRIMKKLYRQNKAIVDSLKKENAFI